MPDRLTDTELRAAAARRPGYATYPEYAPGCPERLGRLPAVAPASAPPARPVRREADMWSSPCRQWPVGPTPAPEPVRPAPTSDPEPTDAVAIQFDKRISAEDAEAFKAAFLAASPGMTLVELPPSPVFDFQPRRIARPWWRRRWHWGVIAAGAKARHGYAWTEAGARRRTDREVRRAER